MNLSRRVCKKRIQIQVAAQAAGDDDDSEITAEYLRRWAQLRWESILHYMVRQETGVELEM